MNKEVDKLSTTLTITISEGTMRVVSREPFRIATENYPNDAEALDRTYRALKTGTYPTPEALKRIFPSLDNYKYKDRWWVIDIGGNNLRLIAFIDFRFQLFFVKHIATHSEYDKLNEQYRKNRD